MGDTAVDFFLKTLQQLITSSNLGVIIDEKHQLQSLEEEIKYLRGFLKITEKKRNEHSEVMKLVTQIRDVVSEAENIVELFVALAFKDHLCRWDKFFEWSSLRKLMFYCICFQDHLSLDLESVKKEIKTLTAEVKQIYDNNMYDMNGATIKKLKHSSSGSGGSLGGSNTSKLGEEKVVVGFEKEKRSLMEQLHISGKGGPLEIISIIGAPGAGKTTLAKEVYQAPLTSHAYEILAWVVVSQDYDKTTKRDMLISILKSASQEKHEDSQEKHEDFQEKHEDSQEKHEDSQEKHEDYTKSSEDILGEKVHKCLKGRKYLIVMDDIWSIEAWTDIQRSFPKECKGSKVLLTSRQLVVQLDSNCHVHRLAPLQEKDSWELLQKKVFGMKCCPPKLVDIGKQIAEKCGGLPLAIVTIAGILATEDKTLDVWVEVASHLSSIIAKKQEGCMEILDLSYNHLPLHLKACFLYIGAHPEDFEITVRELIWLWIAEGFIQQSEGGKSLEDIAEDYLTGLIDRSLVMVAKKSDAFGGIKACRIHDLLRELCLKKAKEDNFFVKIYEDDPSPSITCKHRRLFIGHQFFHKFSSRPHARNLRSFLCLSLPNSSGSSLDQNLSFFVKNFKLLRVLNFITATSLGEIGIGDLVQLRYLALKLQNGGQNHTEPHLFPCTPNCFHYLSNLETLDLQVLFWDKISLPGDIVKMVKLRHLYTKEGIFQYHVSHEEEEGYMLDSLQTLYQICPCQLCLRLLVRTPNLRTLGVFGRVSTPLDLGFLECLEKLKFNWPLTLGSTPPTRGLKLPPTVTRLTLEDTRLKWEELSIFQTLPSLEVLKLLHQACVGPVWNISELEEGFSQLKYLRLNELDIKEWNASADQFPRLEVLVIEYCKELKGIPIDFADLGELRKIKVVSSTQSAAESARGIQEERRNTKGDDVEIITNNPWVESRSRIALFKRAKVVMLGRVALLKSLGRRRGLLWA